MTQQWTAPDAHRDRAGDASPGAWGSTVELAAVLPDLWRFQSDCVEAYARSWVSCAQQAASVPIRGAVPSASLRFQRWIEILGPPAFEQA